MEKIAWFNRWIFIHWTWISNAPPGAWNFPVDMISYSGCIQLNAKNRKSWNGPIPSSKSYKIFSDFPIHTNSIGLCARHKCMESHTQNKKRVFCLFCILCFLCSVFYHRPFYRNFEIISAQWPVELVSVNDPLIQYTWIFRIVINMIVWDNKHPQRVTKSLKLIDKTGNMKSVQRVHTTSLYVMYVFTKSSEM